MKSAQILSPSGVAAQEAAVADCFDPPSERFLGAKLRRQKQPTTPKFPHCER